MPKQRSSFPVVVDIVHWEPFLSCLCFHKPQRLSIAKKGPWLQSSQNVSLLTFLTFSSGLLLCKNSNKQNIPQVGFIAIIWRKKQLFNLPQFGYFSLPFPFQVGKAHSWEKRLPGPRHSERPQRLPGGLMVSLGLTLPWTSSALTFQKYETALKMQPKKKQFAGKSRPLRNPIRSITDWLAVDWKT